MTSSYLPQQLLFKVDIPLSTAQLTSTVANAVLSQNNNSCNKSADAIANNLVDYVMNTKQSEQ
jgi:hypothetical protein